MDETTGSVNKNKYYITVVHNSGLSYKEPNLMKRIFLEIFVDSQISFKLRLMHLIINQNLIKASKCLNVNIETFQQRFLNIMFELNILIYIFLSIF